MAVVDRVICAVLCLSIVTDGAKQEAGQVLISGGRDTPASEVPWHAGIYVQEQGSYSQMCGGTLISSKVVITAAHCFWDERKAQARNNTDLYKVVLGKYHRDFNVDDVGTQVTDVVGIFVHKRFRGRKRKYEYDVAVVQLADEARPTATVQFAMMDWNHTHDGVQLAQGSMGTATGWGITQDGRRSDVLKSVNLPYVDSLTCYDLLTEEFQPMVTENKFCAGYTNRNTSVCPGDSGGGLVFRRLPDDATTTAASYYLRGVVSIAFKPSGNVDKCYAQQVTGFTRLADEGTLKWIKQFPLANLTSTKDRVGVNPDCGVADNAALILAVTGGHLAQAQCLIENGADPLTPMPSTGAAAVDQALLQAGEWGNLDVLRFLLLHGANPSARNAAGHAAVDMALLKAAEWGQLDTVKFLIETHNADPNARHVGKITPLQLAANVGNLDLVQYLIEHGADPVYRYQNTDRAIDAALLKAAEWGQLDMVKYLLEKGGDAGYANKDGYSAGNLALWKAAEWGRTDTARLLTSEPYNVDVSIKNKEGKTALDVARGTPAGSPVAFYLIHL